MPDYVPTRDADLLGFAENFSTKITATPTAYGLVAAQATAFATLFNAFGDAMRTLNDPMTRGTYYVAAKNNARDSLVDGAGGIRQLANLVQAHPDITDLQLIDLRLTVRDRQPTPVPQPSTAPTIHIGDRYGRTVELRLEDSLNPNSRARPAGVAGAMVYSWVGANPPEDFTTWKCEGNFTRTEIEITFPLTVAPSTQVWFTAQWYNPRGETGPATLPAATTKLDSNSMAEAEAA